MRILPLLFFLTTSPFLFSQVQLQVEIKNATVTTTCTDLFSGPDPLWQVNIENGGWITYPLSGACFTALPNVQFSQTFDCPADLPPSINVCFKVFENDGLFGCNITEACSETICQSFPVPVSGQSDLVLSLPGGLSSGGNLEFSIKIVGNYLGGTNDRICEALDLGVLSFNNRLGNAAAGGFNNLCAGNAGDPNPISVFSNAWQNDAAVWFSFKTGPNPSGGIYLNALSDPLLTGDPISLQLAIFESSNDTCTGNLSLIQYSFLNTDNNEGLPVFCPKPNRRYYILVDGDENPGTQRGEFGIEVIDPGIMEGGDLRCQAYNLGPVPEGGMVESPWQSNYCATAVGDPLVRGFVSQRSVFFRVEPPASGHFIIEAISDRLLDSIGLQIAIYRSSNNLCNGFWTQVASFYTEEGLDEQLEVSCLTPQRPYFILIDGDAYDTYGIFKIRVTDLGDDTPIFNLVDTICAGQQIRVGASVYNQTGNYVDTLQLSGGCDSVVRTMLTVLDPITPSIIQDRRANGLGSPTGSLIASAIGGSGRYQFLWSNGFSGANPTNLIGGQNYCVTITDDQGCTGTACFDVEYIHPIIPTFSNSSVNCFGDTNGSIRFSVNNGEPPYQYFWASQNNQLNGNGNIPADNQPVQINDLPAGIYQVTVSDIYTDTIFSIEITQPSEIRISVAQKRDASCFGVCDGSIQVNVLGGVGNYTYDWSTGMKTSQISGLCAGGYVVTVMDGNGCRKLLPVQIVQPAEFIATAQEIQPVSCFGGSDGIASVSTNGNPASFAWSNGSTFQQSPGLSAGNYSVTITNADGCKDTTAVSISQPAEPVSVGVSVQKPITCFGQSDGILLATPDGPGINFSFSWSNGVFGEYARSLPAGNYFVTVANEKGCQSVDSFQLGQPEQLAFSFSTKNLNCLDPPNGGAISISNTTGGLPPYQYSLDGINFSDDKVIGDLVIGTYEIILRDSLGCEKQSPFYILPPPVLEVNIQAKDQIELGDEIEIRAFPNSLNVVFDWSDNVHCVHPDCESFEIIPIETDKYSVTVTDTLTFCTASAEILVEVLKKYDVFIPNAFSPNYDGLNDKLAIFGGKSVAMVEQFSVFDRFGAHIFSLKDFEPVDENLGWDGQWRGKELDPGVYVYFAEIKFIDGTVKIFKGDVTLFR